MRFLICLFLVGFVFGEEVEVRSYRVDVWDLLESDRFGGLGDFDFDTPDFDDELRSPSFESGFFKGDIQGYDCLDGIKSLGLLQGSFEGAFYDVEKKGLVVKADRIGHALLKEKVRRANFEGRHKTAKISIGIWKGEGDEMSFHAESLERAVVINHFFGAPFGWGDGGEGMKFSSKKGVNWSYPRECEMDLRLVFMGVEVETMVSAELGEWCEVARVESEKLGRLRVGVKVTGLSSSGEDFEQFVVKEDGSIPVELFKVLDGGERSEIDWNGEEMAKGRFLGGVAWLRRYNKDVEESNEDLLARFRKLSREELTKFGLLSLLGPVVDCREQVTELGIVVPRDGYVVVDQYSEMVLAKLPKDQMDLLRGVLMFSDSGRGSDWAIEIEERTGAKRGEDERRVFYRISGVPGKPSMIGYQGVKYEAEVVEGMLGEVVEGKFSVFEDKEATFEADFRVRRGAWRDILEEFQGGEWRGLRVRVGKE